jgi:hypothetical protein
MLKNLFLACVVGLSLGACTVSQSYQITGKPVGTKVGVSQTKPFAKAQDYTIRTAVKNGNIKTVGAVQVTQKIVFIPTFKTTVFGE